MDAFDSEEFDAISWINSNLSSNSNNNKDSSAENDHTTNHQRISTLIMKLQILAQVRHFETSRRPAIRSFYQSVTFIHSFHFFFSLNHMYFDPSLNHLHIIHQSISHVLVISKRRVETSSDSFIPINRSFICLFNFFFSLNHMYFDPYHNHLHIIHQSISHDIFLQ